MKSWEYILFKHLVLFLPLWVAMAVFLFMAYQNRVLLLSIGITVLIVLGGAAVFCVRYWREYGPI